MDHPTMDCHGNNTNARASSAGPEGLDLDLKKEVKPGRTINFAEKMHLVLSNKECQDAISWLPAGRSFCITNKEKFVKNILPKFFKSRANFNSFERRLKTWGFSKIDASSKVYVFSHDTFNRSTHTAQELDDKGGGNSFNVMKQLRILLSDTEFQSFIWWLPNGESFCVASTSDLTSKVLFQYFGETQFKSFYATLKREGFERVKTSEHFGDAVYSHDLFRRDRPDLCSRMCRGGSAELNSHILGEDSAAMNASLSDTFLMPGTLGKNPFPMAVGMPSMSNLSGVMNPSVMAQRQNMNFNFPIPMNKGIPPQFSGSAQAMSAAGIPPASHPLLNSAYPTAFAFNRMGSQTMADMQMKQFAHANLNHRESLLLKQNQLLQGSAGSPSLLQQEQQLPSANQQTASNMLSRRHSMMAATEQLPQQSKAALKSESADTNEAQLERRNSAPVQFQSQTGQNFGGVMADATKMSIMEIEDELLRVKEMKLMMMKRKLETQLETNEKK